MPEFIEYTVKVQVKSCKRCGSKEEKAALERYCDPCEKWFDENNYEKCDVCGDQVPRSDLADYSAFHDACGKCRKRT